MSSKRDAEERGNTLSVEGSCYFCSTPLYGYRKDGLWVVPSNCPSCDADVSHMDWDELAFPHESWSDD